MTKKQKRLLIRISISAILFILAWCASELIPLKGLIRTAAFLIPYFVIGYDILLRAVRNIFGGQVFDENFLMSIATIGAFAIGELPEAVAVMLFYQVGELFQGIAVSRSRRSIAALMDIRPDHANVLRSGMEERVSPDEVRVGETIIVRSGERIPLDGVITEGFTTVNNSALTGESLPQDRQVGESVISGTVNISGVIQVRVTNAYAESTVKRILDLVENSAAKKARTENFITRFSRYYTPCVVIAAVLLAVLPPLVFNGGWEDWIGRALTFLVVSCPCALVISVPLSFFGGIGGASRRGILIKGANYIEALSKVDTVVFDKTGTLTRGSFSVTAIHPQVMSAPELLDIAALAESYSNHPIAESIVREHKGHIDMTRIGCVTEMAGKGVCAEIDGRQVLAGSERLLKEHGIAPHGECECLRECAVGTTVHIAVNGAYCGHIVIADEVKAEAASAIKKLSELRISEIQMLTGDTEAVGTAVGRILGIDAVHSELLPDGKVELVERLLEHKKKGTTLAFVGDGVNDAPVLSRSDVGIAMGALGSDAAIEAADVVLTDDDPQKVAEAIRLSRRTMRIVRQNIAFALIVKGAVLLLGALDIAGMWVAVFADVGVSVLAILNATRALRPTNRC